MRRLLLVMALVPLVAVCGGGVGQSATATTLASTTAKPVTDPGRLAIIALFRAATHHDTKALWNVLSKPSQRRLGGYAAFKAHGAAQIERALQPFDRHTVFPFVSQSLSHEFGIVAIRSGTKALAFPLRHEGKAWKVETPGPITFTILSPTPGSTGSVLQVAVEVKSPGVVDDAVVWVDGKLLRPTLAPAAGKATVFANLSKPLPKGGHIAVVFAEQGSNASAEAWSFRASG